MTSFDPRIAFEKRSEKQVLVLESRAVRTTCVTTTEIEKFLVQPALV